MSDKSLFYKSFDAETEIDEFFDRLQRYAEASDDGNPVYILDKPLSDKKYAYSYEKAVVILVPKHKLLFLNYGNNEDAFEDYVEDFLEDISHLSDKYNYMKILGRARKWREEQSKRFRLSVLQRQSAFKRL